ncbi:MAG: hypothetical protein DMG65_12240 [Candidatus Angelobacter sp. Gp1-AA117]|nr:MAG: hypothetical protein DMG65_12240 [Candidatus Angelobacter sp. Gp1-AA117]
MVREHELYYGAALLKLISLSEYPVEIKPFASFKGNSSYVINGKVGIYIKHSTLRMSPWGFTFQRIHQDELTQLEAAFNDTFLLLICETDGVVILASPEVKTLLNLNHGGTQWISVKRGKREQYQVKGSNGQLAFKVADSDYPRKLLAALKLTKE